MHTRNVFPRGGKRGRRALVAALLAVEMAVAPAMGAIAPSIALADPTPEEAAAEAAAKAAAKAAARSITINNIATNVTSYTAYRIFGATIYDNNLSDDDRDYATNVTWASDAAKAAVIAFLDTYDVDETTNKSAYQRFATGVAHDDAQNALEFISEHINSSANDTNFGTVTVTPGAKDISGNAIDTYSKKGDTFAQLLATHLYSWNKDSNHTAIATFAVPRVENQTYASKQFDDEGFYLIATDQSSIDAAGETGTAPIWVAIGGHAKTINEKAAVAGLAKAVLDDRYVNAKGDTIVGVPSETSGGGSEPTTTHNISAAWRDAADANTKQDLWYRLDGTLPANLDSHASYHYQFDDTLAPGMRLTCTQGEDNTGTNDVDESIFVTGGVHVVLYKNAAVLETVKYLQAVTSDAEPPVTTPAFASDAESVTVDDGEGGTTTQSVATYYDITSAVAGEAGSITYANNKLSVTIKDLRTIAGNSFAVDKDTHVVVYYQAQLIDGTAASPNPVNYGQTNSGNVSGATLTYTGDPIDIKTGTANADGLQTLAVQNTSTYTYELELTKRDKSNGALLANAKYAIRVANGSAVNSLNPTNTDALSMGKHVKTTGELVEVGESNADALAYGASDAAKKTWAETHASDDLVFTTDANGKIDLKGIDEGVYVIEELVAPGGNDFGVYQVQDAPIILTVSSDPTDNYALSATVSGGETTNVNDSRMVTRIGYVADETIAEATVRKHYTQSGRYSVGAAEGSGKDSDEGLLASYGVSTTAGLVQLLTVDDRALLMPITGMTGQQLAIIVGGTLIVVSLAGGLLVGGRRKRTNT